MIRKFVLLLVLIAAILVPFSAFAEIKEGSVELNPFIGAIGHEGGENLEVAPVFGLRLGYNFTPHLGVEGAIDFSRARLLDKKRGDDGDLHFGKSASAVSTYMYHADAIYHFTPESRFVPFVVAGIGGVHFEAAKDRNKLMANAGIGAKYWLTESTALRFDVRDVVYIGSVKQNLETTLGLVLALGGKGKSLPEPAPEPAPVKPAPKPAPAPAPAPVQPAPEKKPEVLPAAKAEPVKLEDVHFDFDKATLTEQAKTMLRKDADILKQNRNVNVRAEGNTCRHGEDDYNMRLSERRAEAAKEYLTREGGIDESRITTIGYGKTRPLCDEKPTPKNKNSDCMKSNRRVHFEVIEK